VSAWFSPKARRLRASESRASRSASSISPRLLDEARGDDLALCVDRGLCRGAAERADRGNPAGGDGHVRVPGWRAGSVGNAAATDEEVVRLLRAARLVDREHGRGQPGGSKSLEDPSHSVGYSNGRLLRG
jgi:hypothetical protein